MKTRFYLRLLAIRIMIMIMIVIMIVIVIMIIIVIIIQLHFALPFASFCYRSRQSFIMGSAIFVRNQNY